MSGRPRRTGRRLAGERPARVGPSHVSPVCRDLVRASPKISVDLILTDRFVELIDERMDVVVRIGVLRDSDLVLNWPRQTRFSGETSPHFLDFTVPRSWFV